MVRLKPYYFTVDELHELGINKVGENVKINRTSILYDNDQKCFGDNVRIDHFCVLGGKIEIGSYVHIGAHSGLFGRYGIKLEDFSGISSNVMVYSRTDDYNGDCMTNPLVGDEYVKFKAGQVILKKHAVVGSGSVILCDLTIGEGSAVGAMSLVNKSLEPWGVYFGVPVKRFKDRNKGILNIENKYFINRSKKISDED